LLTSEEEEEAEVSEGGKNNRRRRGKKKQQDAVAAAGFSRALRPCLKSIAIQETLTLRLPAAASSSRPLMVLKSTE
jgi:hypothetical protein